VNIFLALLAGICLFIAGGIVGSVATILRRDREETPLDVPVTIAGAVVTISAEARAPSGAGRVGAYGELPDVTALPAGAHPQREPARVTGFIRPAENWAPARMATPDDWESTAEEVERLERRLVQLSGLLAAELEADVRQVDADLASGRLADPEWIGAR
jgi:hypothetical protein